MNKTKLGFKNLYLPVFIIFMGIGVQILISCSSDDGGSGSGASADGGGISQSSSSFGSGSYSSSDGKQGDYSSSSGGDNQSNVSSSSSGGDIQSNGSSSSSGGEISISSSIGSSSSSIGNVISSSSSEVSSFIYGSFTYEGQTYKTIVIGTQTWMAENLNYNASGSRCYKDDLSNCTEYGRLYSWATAMTVCPDGWHLPSDNEWNTLVNYAGGSSTAGAKLKARSGWVGVSNGNGTDDYGFSALPGGVVVYNSQYPNGFSSDIGGGGSWWGITENGANAYTIGMGSSTESTRQVAQPSFWFSVRCLQGSSQVKSSSSFSSSSVSSSSSKGCTAADNNETLYCSNGKMNEYGSMKYGSRTYKTVVIGTQTWMAENLNSAVAGSKCGDKDEQNEQEYLTDDNTIYCDKYGRLYNWATAMALFSSCNSNNCIDQLQSPHRGICPEGWHIPNNGDWDILYRYVDGTSGTSSPYGSSTAGRYLKAASGWNDGKDGTDNYGFSALPGGVGYSNGSFSGAGIIGSWWSVWSNITGDVGRRTISISETASWGTTPKNIMNSIRCLQD